MANEKIQIVSEIKISYHPRIKICDCPIVKSSRDAYQLFLAGWDTDMISLTEHFKVMVLNRAGRVMGIYLLATGGTSSVVVDPKIVFKLSLRTHASSVIVAHNHPSENLTPSQADIDLTAKLRAGGKILEISLLDHLIITPDNYFSFADEGLMN